MAKVNKKPEDFLPLTDNTWHLLMVLGDSKSWHGYAMNKQMEIDGGPRLGAATLYRTIHSLLEDGLIEEAPAPADETDPRRVYYRISGMGQRVVNAQMALWRDRERLAKQKPAFGPLMSHA